MTYRHGEAREGGESIVHSLPEHVIMGLSNDTAELLLLETFDRFARGMVQVRNGEEARAWWSA